MRRYANTLSSSNINNNNNNHKYADNYLTSLEKVFKKCKEENGDYNIKNICKEDGKLTIDIETKQFGKGHYLFQRYIYKNELYILYKNICTYFNNCFVYIEITVGSLH